MSGRRFKSALLAALPPPWPVDLRPKIRAAVAAHPEHKLVVLDDDPTGTQTVHDVPVLTTWEETTLRAEFNTAGPCFYVLTNSRSLAPDKARALALELAQNLRAAAGSRRFTIVSRSDSTLRGHFPLETDALAEVLGPFDATLLIPYFEDGGRYTIEDTHYVADGDELVPAAETPFARDAAFGYRNSNLCAYVEEKTGGRVKADAVASIGLAEMRCGGPGAVTTRLLALPPGTVCVVNAAAPRDLDVLIAGVLTAESQGRRYCFRTAAQFVSGRLGLEPRPLWRPSPAKSFTGGLTIVGSHVPKTTEQLDRLLRLRSTIHSQQASIETIEVRVADLLDDKLDLAGLAQSMSKHLANGRDVVLATSRELVTGAGAITSFDIGHRVSSALVEIVRQLTVRPRYLIAKGGITSSDLATRGLAVKRAVVLGQLLPGVPVWELGPETKFPGLPYIVFPGNVGGPDALADAVIQLSTPNSNS